MQHQNARPAMLVSAMLSTLLVACGGGDPASDVNASDREQALRKGADTVTVAGPSPLPTTPPEAGVLVHETFGLGTGARPYGDKGLLRTYTGSTTLNDFWVEYPGSKNAKWLTPQGDQTWKFCGGRLADSEYRLASPLETNDGNWGCMVSQWTDPVTVYPTALLRFTPPAEPYSVAMSGMPPAVAGTYVAIGLTASSALLSNFTTVGQVWLGARYREPIETTQVDLGGGQLVTQIVSPLVYEWRVNGRSGPLLATGVVSRRDLARLQIRYDPVARSVSASVNGVALGSHPLTISPAYAGFEGVGVMDNFVIRRAP